MDFRNYETRKLSVADDLKNLAKVHWIHLETESESFVHSVMRPNNSSSSGFNFSTAGSMDR